MTWTGAVSSDWFDPANWSSGVPGAGDNVTISTATPHSTTINGNTATLGNVTVSNSGTLDLASGSYTNTGVFTVSSGGTVSGGTVGTIIDGGSVASHDLLIVTGPGSTYTDGGTLTIGKAAVGELTLADGGKYSAPSVIIASQVGSIGYLNIGAGITHSGPTLPESAVAPGTLDAASVTFGSGSGFLIFNHTSNNYVFAPTISGNGEIAVFSGTTKLTANSSGFSGTLSVGGGELNVAGELGFTNTHIEAGTLRVTGTMTGVGGFGDLNVEGGNVVIENGGFVTGRDGSISNGGNVTVSGAGSRWTNNSVIVGEVSSGTFVIQNQGRVDSMFAEVGEGAAGGTATVTGAGSRWNIANSLLVGSSADGTLGIANGGVVSGQTISIGFTNFALPVGATESGHVTVTGTGSQLDMTGIVYVGATVGDTAAPGAQIKSGALTVADGGQVSGQSIQIATQANAVGSLNIGAELGQAAVAPGTVDALSVVLGAGNSQVVFNHTAEDYSFAPVISGTGQVHVLAGRTILTGANTYTGPTTIDGGTLQVDGSIASSSLTSVNSGGVLAGTGTVGVTQINAGGTFAPGNFTPGSSTTISGNLAFQSAAIYLVQINPSTSSFANVTGSATLDGATVNAVYATGSYVSKRYTILNATGGVSGTFGALVNTNLPATISTGLSYDANHAYLDLKLNFTTPNVGTRLTVNQQAVANALVNSFNANGGIPMAYATLTPAGLTQASGELGTGSQQSTFNAMNQFMGLLTDPFMNRGGTGSAPTGATGYAEENPASAANGRSKSERDAYAMFAKAPLPQVYQPRWSVWAAGFGGSQTINGEPVVLGSNDTRSSIYGTAVGADYLFSPDTVAGFALAGGGTSFSVNNLGSGRSDLFQAGAYLRHTEGPAYITAALAYGWQDITTDRYVTAAGLDHLRAEFNANAWSGRVESGYRFVAPWAGGFGVTPYAAGQFTSFNLPNYGEQAISGTPAFALSYAGKNATDPRSELGFRTDKAFGVLDGVLTLRGRFAWAHDFNTDRSIATTFQALPGASFVVNGAAQPHDSALTSASVEMKWMNGWSASATFEGEFADTLHSYAGKGIVRYTW